MRILAITSICLIFLFSCTPRYTWQHADPHRHNERFYDIDISNCDMYAQREKLEAYNVFKGNPMVGIVMISVYNRAIENCMQSMGWQKIKEDETPVAPPASVAVPQKNDGLKKEPDNKDAHEYFLKNVKPIILAVHPDFDDIILDPNTDYWSWAEKQDHALKYAALNSKDPHNIIWAISTYKKHKQGGRQ